MRVAFAAAELTPWVSTGGLGEVAAALPKALAQLGCDVAVFVPLYRQVRQNVGSRGARLIDTGATAQVWIGGHRHDSRVFRIDEGSRQAEAAAAQPAVPGGGSLATYAVDCPALYDRDGVYGHGDDAVRYSNFARVVLYTAHRLLGGHPDIVHAHDWHTALIPLYLEGPLRRALPNTASVLTIHNLAYQGVFPATEIAHLGLDPALLRMERLGFHGGLNWLQGGIAAADAITTVSPRYAEEIRTDHYGENLQGVLGYHQRRLFGVLNGIDTDIWNPATDKHLSAHFDADNMAGKGQCRRAVLAMGNLDGADAHPVFGVVSRFSKQKGLDLVADLVPYLASRSVRLVLLGKGEPALEDRFQRLERDPHFSQFVRVRVGFEPDLAHILQAGADAMLMPSRYEPCGLTQMYAMRYGTVPIVRGVGGLYDTVVPATQRTIEEKTATGFTYEHDTLAGLQWAVDRALDTYYTQQPVWQQLQRTGMTTDFSWRQSAQHYLDIYKMAIRRVARNQ